MSKILGSTKVKKLYVKNTMVRFGVFILIIFIGEHKRLDLCQIFVEIFLQRNEKKKKKK
jgi:hypothetical protein